MTNQFPIYCAYASLYYYKILSPTRMIVVLHSKQNVDFDAKVEYFTTGKSKGDMNYVEKTMDSIGKDENYSTITEVQFMEEFKTAQAKIISEAA